MIVVLCWQLLTLLSTILRESFLFTILKTRSASQEYNNHKYQVLFLQLLPVNKKPDVRLASNVSLRQNEKWHSYKRLTLAAHSVWASCLKYWNLIYNSAIYLLREHWRQYRKNRDKTVFSLKKSCSYFFWYFGLNRYLADPTLQLNHLPPTFSQIIYVFTILQNNNYNNQLICDLPSRSKQKI